MKLSPDQAKFLVPVQYEIVIAQSHSRCQAIKEYRDRTGLPLVLCVYIMDGHMKALQKEYKKTN